MKLTLNGDEYIAHEVGTVEDLLRELNIHPQSVAVEVNLKIVRKAEYGSCMLHDGDAVEVVGYVGGGAPRMRRGG